MGIAFKQLSRGHGAHFEIRLSSSSKKDLRALQSLKDILAPLRIATKTSGEFAYLYEIELSDDDPEVVLRFSAEQTRLALVDHPMNPKHPEGKFRVIIIQEG